MRGDKSAPGADLSPTIRPCWSSGTSGHTGGGPLPSSRPQELSHGARRTAGRQHLVPPDSDGGVAACRRVEVAMQVRPTVPCELVA